MQPACICTQPTNPNWSGAIPLKHCKCTGKHISFLMSEKKGSSHDHLPREQKEQPVLQSVAQKGITIYIPMIMNLIFFFSWRLKYQSGASGSPAPGEDCWLGKWGNWRAKRPLNFYAAFFPREVLESLEAAPAGTSTALKPCVSQELCTARLTNLPTYMLCCERT